MEEKVVVVMVIDDKSKVKIKDEGDNDNSALLLLLHGQTDRTGQKWPQGEWVVAVVGRRLGNGRGEPAVNVAVSRSNQSHTVNW